MSFKGKAKLIETFQFEIKMLATSAKTQAGGRSANKLTLDQIDHLAAVAQRDVKKTILKATTSIRAEAEAVIVDFEGEIASLLRPPTES